LTVAAQLSRRDLVKGKTDQVFLDFILKEEGEVMIPHRKRGNGQSLFFPISKYVVSI
jgi:hypothetical protein